MEGANAINETFHPGWFSPVPAACTLLPADQLPASVGPALAQAQHTLIQVTRVLVKKKDNIQDTSLRVSD